MGLLTFALNVTLDGCCDHREAIADDELLRYYTRLMDGAGAMLFGRTTYELMESAWPAVARDPKAPPALREWARKLEAKPKYVVSSTRRDFPWSNTFRVEGNLREAIAALKRRTPRGVLVGSPMLSAALEQLGLIDEYRLVAAPDHRRARTDAVRRAEPVVADEAPRDETLQVRRDGAALPPEIVRRVARPAWCKPS